MLSHNLQFLMNSRQVNAHNLQDAVGVNQPTIHRILTGESQDPRTSTLKPLADFFGVTVNDLREKNLSGDENLEKKEPPILLSEEEKSFLLLLRALTEPQRKKLMQDMQTIKNENDAIVEHYEKMHKLKK